MKFKSKKEKDSFIMDNIKLVDFVINKRMITYNTFEYEYEDIKSMGIIGLINAVNRYDEKKGYEFSTFAISCIVGEIFLYIRETRYGIRYGRKILMNKSKIDRMLENMTIKEVAKELKLKEKDVYKIHYMNLDNMSLNYIYNNNDNGDGCRELIDYIPYEMDFNKNLYIRDLFECLTEREENVLIKYFFQEFSQKEIAEELNISQVQISRIIRKAISKIKKAA